MESRQTEHFRDGIHDHAGLAAFHIYDHDARRIGAGRFGDAETLAHIDHRQNAAAQVDDALHEVRNTGAPRDVRQPDDLCTCWMLTPNSSCSTRKLTYCSLVDHLAPRACGRWCHRGRRC